MSSRPNVDPKQEDQILIVGELATQSGCEMWKLQVEAMRLADYGKACPQERKGSWGALSLGSQWCRNKAGLSLQEAGLCVFGQTGQGQGTDEH